MEERRGRGREWGGQEEVEEVWSVGEKRRRWRRRSGVRGTGGGGGGLEWRTGEVEEVWRGGGGGLDGGQEVHLDLTSVQPGKAAPTPAWPGRLKHLLEEEDIRLIFT